MKYIVFITFTLSAMLLIAIFGIVLENTYSKKFKEQKISAVQSQCNILSNQIVSSGFRISEEDKLLTSDIEQVAASLDGRLIILDENCRIVKDTYGLEDDHYLVTEDMLRAMNGEMVKAKELDGQYMDILTTIVDSDSKKIKGLIVATVSTKETEELLTYIHSQSSMLYSVFLLIVVLFSIGMSFLFTRSLNKMNQSVKYIADGHADDFVEVSGYTELRDMATNFNDILRKMRVLENSRQEFVSNVSHELKTPITSVKVLAESLLMQDGIDVETYREFMSDIVEEIDRENKIINDLLSLVKMDKSQQNNLTIESVNINELIESILRRLKPLAQKREIEMTFESFRPVMAEIDEVKLTLAITNLVENAIKYNVDNGWIRVTLNADHKYFYVKVQDSGVGIPEDCQDFVFERFYRVDKARSRETGGTGLGLAITRNVVLLHKGAIKVYSKNIGSTFTMRIPLMHIV